MNNFSYWLIEFYSLIYGVWGSFLSYLIVSEYVISLIRGYINFPVFYSFINLSPIAYHVSGSVLGIEDPKINKTWGLIQGVHNLERKSTTYKKIKGRMCYKKWFRYIGSLEKLHWGFNIWIGSEHEFVFRWGRGLNKTLMKGL